MESHLIEMNGCAIYIFSNWYLRIDTYVASDIICPILDRWNEQEVNNEDKNSEGLKITLSFARRYLRNR